MAELQVYNIHPDKLHYRDLNSNLSFLPWLWKRLARIAGLLLCKNKRCLHTFAGAEALS